jgi:hypothetical protein
MKVMGKKVTVGLTEGLMIHQHNHDDNVIEALDLLGLYDQPAMVIALDKAQSPDRLKETFLHETLHALIYEVAPRDVLTFEEEEAVVRRLAPVMLLFLRENPAVYTFLTGRYTYR